MSRAWMLWLLGVINGVSATVVGLAVLVWAGLL